ncbi:hypothetical protein G3545_16540 [Starkeya sp. ORNL1]|jgi:hypothetical protein|uniref:hypothetical protein n=1 Tax=Starkeya sp. ORNL1 TaxID=2709380 RepID=UPI00146456B9|nr:hypothetical protein [Starkeya sp. ORNL1]QJP15114.1 hypothetical protein G3545_16540 [Starkeya sp. ORNL1]
MDPALIKLVIELISGAVGGNLAGAASKNIDLGTLWNSVAGIVGGGIGGQILSAVLGAGAASGGGLDIGSIIQQVAGGGVGGAVLLAIVGIIKNAMAKSA